MRRKREGRKKAPAVDRAEVRFNGENLRGVFHHFKVWLHEVCYSEGKVRQKYKALFSIINVKFGVEVV